MDIDELKNRIASTNNKDRRRTILKPFVRKKLDILFVGLNPATVSSRKGHYFSVRQSFWEQLFVSGLITQEVNKDFADELIFGSTDYNYKHYNYGIIDLVNYIAESNSSKIKPTINDCIKLESEIKKYKPKIVVILHNKVLKYFIFRYLNVPFQPSNSGRMGNLMPNCKSVFYNIAFPHGNKISKSDKITRYKQVKKELSQTNK